MNYQITSDNVEISNSMKELALEKLSRVENKLKNVPEGSKSCRVVLNTAPDETFEVKLDVVAEGESFFTSEVGYSLEAALLLAIEELERQIEKSKFGGSGWEDTRESKRFPTDNPDIV
jgi:ribosomal subunit interface protein